MFLKVISNSKFLLLSDITLRVSGCSTYQGEKVCDLEIEKVKYE